MSRRLDGKVAIVTGAGQGIGRGCALALAREGAAVLVTGRTAGKLEKVVGEIAELGGRAQLEVLDAGSRQAATSAAEAAVAAFGRLDILVNNAQSSVQRTLAETTDDDVELAYRSGTLATLYHMQACLPHLRERGGSIVNFGSSAAVDGNPTFGSYAIAKEAIRGLSRVAAREWGRFDIRVNVVCPASLTPAAAAYRDADPDRFAGILAQIPLGRMGDPESDIGRAVVALAGDDLRFLSGATLMLDGGRVRLA